MIEVLFVTLVALLAFGFAGWAAWTRFRVHAPAEQVEGATLLRADHTPTVEHQLVEEARKIAVITGEPITTVLLRLQRAATDPVAAGGLRASFPAATATPSRGVHRVPDRLQVERTVPLPPPIRDRAPYRNPDRRQRLAKNGRLRPDLPPG